MKTFTYASRSQHEFCTQWPSRRILTDSLAGLAQSNANCLGLRLKKCPATVIGILPGSRCLGKLDPRLIRVTQNSVRDTIKTVSGLRLSFTTAVELAKIGRGDEMFFPIRIFPLDGMLFTLDNRRLLVYALAGRACPVSLATLEEISRELDGPQCKFTTGADQNMGMHIEVLQTSPLMAVCQTP